MKDAFITSTHRHEWNRHYNPRLCRALERRGLAVYLPMRDTNQKAPYDKICKSNLAGIRNSNIVIAVAENESVNWGLEVGYAYGLDKRVITLAKEGHQLPVMCLEMSWRELYFKNLDDIKKYIDTLADLIRPDTFK